MIILFAVIYSVEAKCELQFDLIVIQTKTCLLRSYLGLRRGKVVLIPNFLVLVEC